MGVLVQARPALDHQRAVRVGVDVRQRTVGVVAGEVTVPDGLEQDLRRPAADLRPGYLPVPFDGLGLGGAQHE